MLENPLIFGIACSTIITIIYTIIMIKMHDNSEKSSYNKNNSIILFTISLIIVSLGHLYISSNIKDLNPGAELEMTSNVSSKMLTGTPEF